MESGGKTSNSYQARSQPARWGGGLNLDGWNTRRTPPPLDIVRVTSSTYSKGGTKLLKGGTKLLKGGTKLLKGGTKLLKGGTKLLKGGTKLLKGGTKLLKGGTKSLGWATGGGRTTPPTPPGYGPGYFILGLVSSVLLCGHGNSLLPHTFLAHYYLVIFIFSRTF